MSPGESRQNILVDQSHYDDAAIVRVAPGRDLVLTADVIAPLVDDPESFGAIAAANSLSDVWAMGGEPRFALNLVFFPDDSLPIEVLDAILAAGARTCAEAGVAIVGGHSVRDAEVKYGLSVTGDVAPDELWSNRTAKPGQVLVLSKAIGSGVIGQAIKKGLCGEVAATTAIRSMMKLNQSAARIGHKHGVTAATDVTGFGLLGHLRNITRGSGVGAVLDLGTLPLLPEAMQHMRAKQWPGGSKANRKVLSSDIRWEDGSPFAAEMPDVSDREVLASLSCDAQTSGGLLLCVPAERAQACVDDLLAAGLAAAAIGSMRPAADSPASITLRP
ncbi:MAG: selenide, water dikinase SelD [Myxococcota bacterium]|nr:selenide, water dikinase SelD [Myxococcota bacterium]